MSNDVEVILGGVSYNRWKSLSVTHKFEQIYGEADITISEKPGDPLPTFVGDTVEILLNDEMVIKGNVSGVSGNTEYGTHDISIKCKEKARDFAQSTVGPKVNINAPATLKQVVEKTVKGMELNIKVTDELSSEPFEKGEMVVPSVDEYGFAFVERFGRKRQAIINSDGKGGMVITRNLEKSFGTNVHLTMSLEPGITNNIKSVSFDHSDDEQHNSVGVAAQRSTADANYWEDKPKDFDDGEPEKISNGYGVANNTAIRPERRLHLRGITGTRKNTAKETAEWHNNLQRSRGMSVTVTVANFSVNEGGPLWWHGYLVPTKIDHYLIDDLMFIKSVTFNKDFTGGSTVQLELGVKDSYKKSKPEGSKSPSAGTAPLGSAKTGTYERAFFGEGDLLS